MPWTLGDVHVDTLHASRDVHINGENVANDINLLETNVHALPSRSPDYYVAKLSTTIVRPYGILITLGGLTVESASNLGVFDASGGVFTAPRAALYSVSYNLGLRDAIAPFTAGVTSVMGVKRSSAAAFSDYRAVGFIPVSGSNWAEQSCSINTLIFLNDGDQIRNTYVATTENPTFTEDMSEFDFSLLALYTHQSVYSIT